MRRLAATVLAAIRTVWLPLLCLLASPAGAQPAPGHTREPATVMKSHRLLSPDGRIELVVHVESRLSYDVSYQDKPMLAGATLALDVDHVQLGIAPRVKAVARESVSHVLKPAVRQKAATIEEKFNQLRLTCEGNYAVVFRAYDQGVAYRFETTLPNAAVTVYGEQASFAFAAPAKPAVAAARPAPAAADAGAAPYAGPELGAYFPQEESFFSHNERKFPRRRLAGIPATSLASVPVVVETAAGPKVAIADSDVEDYPGLWFHGTGANALTATFPPYPLEEKELRDRDIKITRAADYIARTRGTRSYPWRAIGVAPSDKDLVTSTLIYLLASPSRVADTSWIRPGKVAWDWWNALNLKDVAFKPGVNTATYEHYIDFAARHGIEYVILDEGWYPFGNLLATVPAIDMPAILAHAKKKNVGIILWVVWKTLDLQFKPALELFARWGVKGLKVDFMQRDDQPVMAFYYRVCAELAKRKMLVDFHGGIRPAEMTRTWPNLMSTEGVQGLEHVKWSRDTEPEHDLSLPFTRMFLGPMDYTPGAMLNADRASFKIVFNEPMSMGTRVHQLAMYVVFESPLQMLADSPTHYEQQPEAMEFLGPVPSVWDESRVLDGTIGDFIVVARRRGAEWYLGAMTDWTPRAGHVELSFLGPGEYQMTSYQDGPDADHKASDYRKTISAVSATTKVDMNLAPGGGWVARIQKKN